MAAARRISGRITSTLRWPLRKRTTGMWLASGVGVHRPPKPLPDLVHQRW